MAPFLRILASAFVVSETGGSSKQQPFLSSSTSTPTEALTADEDFDLSKLCELFGAEPLDLISLRTNERGIRGVYLNKAVEENEVILKIPLDSCLRDDSPPNWLQLAPTGGKDENDAYAVSVEGWVTRLTACLLDAQQNKDERSEAIQTWLELLPTNLREILPIYWGSSDSDDSSLLASAQCRSLELTIDSAYFARSGPIGDLMASLRDTDFAISQRQIEDALDLVQTRSCRAVTSDDTPYMRVLVPIFDMINHARDHNAEFFRQGDFMVVRALKSIDAGQEVFINYGDSTRPAWKCLFSYGFVPLTEDIYEDDVAEIVVDGARIEVGPTEIPFELVQYEAEQLGLYKEGEELEFTPEIGQKIVDRITTAAKELETASATLQNSDIIAFKSVADLLESNRRTLLACAGGLREYLEDL